MKVYVLIKEVPQPDFHCGGLAAQPARRILNIYESPTDACKAYDAAMRCDAVDVEELGCDPCDFELQTWDIVASSLK